MSARDRMSSESAAKVLRELASDVENRGKEYEAVEVRVSLRWLDEYRRATPPESPPPASPAPSEETSQ